MTDAELAGYESMLKCGTGPWCHEAIPALIHEVYRLRAKIASLEAKAVGLEHDLRKKDLPPKVLVVTSEQLKKGYCVQHKNGMIEWKEYQVVRKNTDQHGGVTFDVVPPRLMESAK